MSLIRQPIITRRPIYTLETQSRWDDKVKLDWKDAKELVYDPSSGYLKITRKDNRYSWSTVTAIVQSGVLYVRFKSYTKGFKSKYLIVQHFDQFSAVEIIQAYPALGRHFEDVIHQVYHTLGLPLGYVVPILKEV